MARPVGADWRTFLDGFHAQRPGVTEEMLAHSHDVDQTPYQWAAVEAGAAEASVLDLACGSGPMREHLNGP